MERKIRRVDRALSETEAIEILKWKEGKMKTLALIVLIMVMGLSGCASIAGPGLSWKDAKGNWKEYLEDPAGPGLSWKDIKGNWKEYLEDPAGPGLSWKDIKENWRWYLN